MRSRSLEACPAAGPIMQTGLCRSLMFPPMGAANREVVGAEGVVDDGAAVQAVVVGAGPTGGPSVASFVARLMPVVRDQRWSLRSGGNDLELLLKPFDLVLKLEQACQHLATYFILMSGKR